MLTMRPRQERGQTRVDWLDSAHSFSFNHYDDPRHRGFRQLRVINEDWVSPGAGFGMHGHRDMEIITYVLQGALEHRDSMGHGSVIRPGDVQRMSAGTGVRHSEFNHSTTEPVHFLQIWILPEEEGLAPSYEQRSFAIADHPGQWHLVAARGGKQGAMTVHQDMELHVAQLLPGDALTYSLRPGRHAWVQVARGAIRLHDRLLQAGDGAALSHEETLTVSASEGSEVLLFDLA
jgi:redox-sensitive bicupin YhaK (pirin superfamily)